MTFNKIFLSSLMLLFSVSLQALELKIVNDKNYPVDVAFGKSSIGEMLVEIDESSLNNKKLEPRESLRQAISNQYSNVYGSLIINSNKRYVIVVNKTSQPEAIYVMLVPDLNTRNQSKLIKYAEGAIVKDDVATFKISKLVN